MFFNPRMKDIMVRYHQADQRNEFYKAKEVLPDTIVAGVPAEVDDWKRLRDILDQLHVRKV